MRFAPFLLILLAASWPLRAQTLPDNNLIDAMETNTLQMPPEKLHVQVVPGHDGQALRLLFDTDNQGVFARARQGATPAWDEAAGFSFWLKGDGSALLGGIEFIWNNDYAVRYAYAFSLRDTNWHKVVVAWRDLVPELSAKIPLLDAKNGNAPSKLGPIGWGKWWYWGDYSAHSYAIDDIRLEKTIALDTRDWRPESAPLARVAAKLRAKQAISIATMGDSLTDARHWTNRAHNWPQMLKTQIADKLGSEITLINPALGGTELRHNLILIPRWLEQNSRPDLVTIFFGFNDYSAGMRLEQWRQVLADAVDRVRRATAGHADVLILTMCPPLNNPILLDELAQGCREVAQQKSAGLSDIHAAFTAIPLEDRAKLYVDDGVHLSAAGQELVAQTVLQSLQNDKK